MGKSRVITSARLVSLLFGGLFAGFMVCVLVLETSLRAFDGVVYTQVRKVELDSLDALASATLIPALIATAFLVFSAFKAKGSALWLPLAALALMLVVVALSLIVNVPINSDQNDWVVQTPPADWSSVRDRWQTSHVVRTVSAVLAFVCLGVAALIGRPAARTA